MLGLALDPEEYEHFVYTFRQFKDRVGNDQDGATLLRECLATDVSRILYYNFRAALGTFTEEQILTNITKHCVNQQTIQARTTELHRQKQEPGQTVSAFLASLKSKARQCDLKIMCDSCQRHCDFSEKIILTLFLPHPLPFMVGKYLGRGGVEDISLPRKSSPRVACRGWARAGNGQL